MKTGEEKSEIYHIAAGGTIDAHWDGAKDTAVPNAESFIPGYFQNIRFKRLRSRTMFLKDSRDITLNDQDRLADRVAEANFAKILITMGTYLMPDVARLILNHPTAHHFARLDRRVAIVGASKPMNGFLRSDGGFNLGMSIAVLEEENVDRVSVIMNGACFRAAEIRKDLSEAAFSSFGGADQLPYQAFDLISMGGSMDFILDGLDGLTPLPESEIPAYLREVIKIRRQIFAVNPFIRDSRNLLDDDFQKLLEVVHASRTDRILITTGIYKIKLVQRFLQEHLPEEDRKKIIILTGSRFPLGSTDMTDAPFNLGYALGKIGFLCPGIHIALNGKVLKTDEDPIAIMYTDEEIAILKLNE